MRNNAEQSAIVMQKNAKRMDWDNARVFLAAARAGQFLAAAKSLGVDHATVARRMTALEAKLGAKLFDRRTTGCSLTSAGGRFLAAAERIEAEMLRAQSALSDGAGIAGTVRIGAPDGFGTFFLASRLGRLAEAHPDLTVQLAPMPRVFSLSRREADLAITIDRPEEGRLAVRKLTDYTVHFYAAKSYLAAHAAPLAAEDLRRHRLVTYVPDLLFSPALNFMPELFGPSYRRLECASALGQNAAVLSGAGIGMLHDYHAADHPALAMVLPDLVFRRSYWLVTHLDSRDAPRVRTTADFIADAVESERGIFCLDPAP
jgi:DNA-binding transcriptional LysR family regulator